jgi:hypothetical protein
LENLCDHTCQLNCVWFIHLKCISRTSVLSLVSCVWRSLEISWNTSFSCTHWQLQIICSRQCLLSIKKPLKRDSAPEMRVYIIHLPSWSDFFLLARRWAILNGAVLTLLYLLTVFFKRDCSAASFILSH